MKILSECDAVKSAGEYDFIFATKEEMQKVAIDLTKHGFMVGGGGENSEEYRATINVEPIIHVQVAIDRARKIIESI